MYTHATFLALTTLTTAHMLSPQPPHPHVLPRSSAAPQSLDQTHCTFTLWHKQLPSATTTSHSSNYIFLPLITDHAANLTLDVAAAKPAQAHNSYARVSATRKFSVKGLRNGRTLTVGVKDDDEDALVFEMGGLRWEVASEKEVEEGEEAWCRGGKWVESGVANRERKVECAFPCAEEVESEERVELK